MEWFGNVVRYFVTSLLEPFTCYISLREWILFAIRFGAKDSFELDLSQLKFGKRRRCVWLVQAEAAAAEWGGWTSAATGCLENPYEGLKNFFLTEVVIGEHFFWADWVSSWSMQLRNLTRSTAIGKIKGKKWNSCFVWNTAWLREDSWFMSIVTWCLWFQFSSCFFLSLLVPFCFCCHSGLRQNERRANELSIMKQQSQEKVSKLEDLEKESERRTLEVEELKQQLSKAAAVTWRDLLSWNLTKWPDIGFPYSRIAFNIGGKNCIDTQTYIHTFLFTYFLPSPLSPHAPTPRIRTKSGSVIWRKLKSSDHSPPKLLRTLAALKLNCTSWEGPGVLWVTRMCSFLALGPTYPATCYHVNILLSDCANFVQNRSHGSCAINNQQTRLS